MVTVYEVAEFGELMRSDAEFLKNALIQAIHETHPTHIFEVDPVRMRRTAQFLRKFELIFTLNYDLLLYWTLVQPDNGLTRAFSDGFKSVDGMLEWDDVPWQKVFYLHGALHVFEQNGRLEKVKYQADAPEGRLIQQIGQRIREGRVPLFVCEGRNEQKLGHTSRSRYLSFCFGKLENCDGILFIFGHSLGDSDQHIADAISRSGVRHLFVSLYGSPTSDRNKEIIRKAERIVSSRSYRKLNLAFYDAESAGIW